MKKSILLLFTVMLAVSCVSTGTYEKKEGELKASEKKNIGLSKENESLMLELKKLKEASDKRNVEYKRLLIKLRTMIDSGSLTIKIRNGRMVVTLPSDILFSSGSTRLSKKGQKTIAELAATLSTLKGRSFIVVGHTDSTPIRTERFASNWELSTARAVVVVKLLIKNGVKPGMLTAGGCAEFDPVANNDSTDNKLKNRRVEIVFMPSVNELPKFEGVK
ncbi:MAG: OmpA family protein [Deltaproteobacteria bacterium]|nr:OmpA family protein [Deltaproteobacteria bacterium]MBW1847288.1 OmpA family protein [Deltaproteobacteria bacterium]